ncbi:restriction endonuclease subunit S [Lactobacillus iners]|uniref:restriction endonuclease subunit S n=1 Tax=Lactobacillus iners TaxID=147802 RepID=UPI00022BF2F2|nr:restriction endonuclease subunit S [Lactobacillus iners]EGY58731.1 hypothetical protein HMPREF1027_01084 [Lactobacillus iners]MCT7856743.1 restriction endonuclease subunit S [Lactobacillus iners]
MIWKNSTLSDISRIGDGAHASLKRVDSGIPYLTAKNITKSGVDYSNMDYISEETYNKHFKEKSNALTQPKTDDILYSIIGTIGGVYVVRDEKIGISSSVAIFRSDCEKVLPHYLAYFLKSSSFDAQVQAIKGGVAQGFMSLEKLGTVNITYPEDIEYQKRIVDVLFAYDSLIENNQKQIKLLEEAAQRLYKEWFVDLNFPGYEDVKIVDGLPEGWKKLPLPKIAPIVTGKKDANFATENGQYLFFTCAQEPIKAPSYSFDCDAVILAGNGDFNVKLYRGQFEAYQRTYVFSPYDSNNLYLLYHAVKNNMRQLFQGASGSTIKFLTKRMLEEIMIYIPDGNTLKTFTKYCESYQKKIEILNKQITFAKEARDRLLPKLMNGEIEV